MIFRRLTSIALIMALSLPSTLMAGRKDHYLKENGDFPLVHVNSSPPQTTPEPVVAAPASANSFQTIPLEPETSATSAQRLEEGSEQTRPTRQRLACTPERLACAAQVTAWTFMASFFIVLFVEMYAIFTYTPTDPCAHLMTLPSATEITGTIGNKRSVHYYQKRRGGGGGRGGAVRICPSTTSRSATPVPTTRLSNFFNLTSEGERISTDIPSTSTDNTPPPLVHQSQE